MRSGERIDQYQILALLGAGGMGEVYRAEDTTLGREVALKVLPRELASDTEFVARFEREAKLLGSLNHPNVATLHAFGEENGTRYLVMELVRGRTLKQMLSDGALSQAEALDTWEQVAAGLQEAHAHGVVHRDLKPANVMLTDDGLVKLLDFGIARPAITDATTKQAETPTDLTVAGVAIGTAPYMSPEQIRGEPVDARTDIWALGCLGYEALAGTRAFDRATSADTMAAILQAEPDWDQLPRQTPTEIRSVLQRCLEGDRRRRPQSVSAVRATIAEVMDSRRAPPPPGRGRGSRLVVTGVVAAAVVSVAVLAMWALLAPRSNPVAVSTAAPETAERPAIAVLPFENLSDDPTQQYFSDGISEDLITRLSSWRSFPVISSFSSFAQDSQPTDVREVGRYLGARYLVMGSVRRAGDRVRIAARLVDTDSGVVAWSDQFDRSYDDVLILQGEISRSIVGAMHPQLDELDRRRAVREEPQNLAAWDWVQRGWWHFYRGTREGAREARNSFQEAAQLEPDLAGAHSGIALSHYIELTSGEVSEPEETIDALVRSAERAVSLDSQDAWGHHALGHAYALTGQRESMLTAFARSVELNPSSSLVLICSGESMALAGQPDEAIEHLDEAMRLSPQDPAIFYALHAVALAHFSAERYAQAVEWASRSVQTQPDFAWGYRTMAASLAHLGRLDEARQALEKAVERQPEFTLAGGQRVLLTADAAVGERYLAGLRLAGMIE